MAIMSSQIMLQFMSFIFLVTFKFLLIDKLSFLFLLEIINFIRLLCVISNGIFSQTTKC